MIVNMSTSSNISDLIALFGFVSIAIYFTFTASSFNYRSILISDKKVMSKFYATVILILFLIGVIFGEIIKIYDFQKFNDFVENLWWYGSFGMPVITLWSLIVFFLSCVLIKLLFAKSRFYVSIVDLFILIVVPVIEGIKILYIIKRFNVSSLQDYDSIVVILVDIIATVLLIGLNHFSINKNSEESTIYLTKEIFNDTDLDSDLKRIINKGKNSISGFVISESDTFLNVLLTEGHISEPIEKKQICINKSYIVGFRENKYDDKKKELRTKQDQSKPSVLNKLIRKLSFIIGRYFFSTTISFVNQLTEEIYNNRPSNVKIKKDEIQSKIFQLHDSELKRLQSLIKTKKIDEAFDMLKI